MIGSREDPARLVARLLASSVSIDRWQSLAKRIDSGVGRLAPTNLYGIVATGTKARCGLENGRSRNEDATAVAIAAGAAVFTTAQTFAARAAQSASVFQELREQLAAEPFLAYFPKQQFLNLFVLAQLGHKVRGLRIMNCGVTVGYSSGRGTAADFLDETQERLLVLLVFRWA